MEKTHESEIRRFENEYSDMQLEKLQDDVYVVNSSINDFAEIGVDNLLFLLPYCLKDLDCDHRMKYTCNSECKKCVMGPMVKFIASNGADPYFIIYDDTDIPKWIIDHVGKKGSLKGVCTVLCPSAAIENKKFVIKHNVPVLMFFIKGFEQCDFKKATLGKFWGKTEFDLDVFIDVINALKTRDITKGGDNAKEEDNDS